MSINTNSKKYHVVLTEEQVAFIENALGNYNPACFESADREECELLQGMFNNLLVDPLNETSTVINDFTL